MSAATPESRHALHIVHGYNEPFLSLSNLYSRALQSDGWRVTTAYLTGRADENVRAQTVADEVVFLDTPDRAMKGLKLALARRVRRLLAPDTALVVAQRYKPLYLALLGSLGRNIPVLGVAHAFGVLASVSRRLMLRRFASRLTLAGVSQAVTDDLRRHEQRLRIVPLPNAIDTAQREPRLLSRAAACQQLLVSEREFVFGNVGRLHDDKDQATIIRAFARIADRHPDARLLLVGKGKRATEYQALVDALHLQGRAVLTGALPDAPTLFPAFDVYVSASDREPFGIVLTEAMLARVPVISTDCGGAPEVLGEHARYFARGDDAALAQHMEALIALPTTERRQQGEHLYARLQQQFAFPPFRERLLALVRRMTGTAP